MSDFVNKFPITEEVRNIFDQQLISDRNKVIQILEEYKFLSRDVILEVLTGTTDFPFVSADSSKKYDAYKNVVLYTVDDSEVFAYIRGFDEFDTNRFELEFSTYIVHFARITPANFSEILVPNYEPEYDPLILFKKIILDAINAHATDVHFDTKHYAIEPAYTVSFRIDAELQKYTKFKINRRLNREMIGKLVEAKTSTASLDLNSPDGITALAKDIFGTNLAELRISANKCLDGFHYVVRIQKKDTVSFTIDQLGFAESVMDDLRYVTRKRSGITLITGAIRTGKNTTAFAIENEMVKQPIKVVSYEYPIEVVMPVSQVDYANDESVLLNAVRMSKKQDVNVAFLNEIPNKEVAFAVQDLVNSSIHVITTMHLDRIWMLPYRLKEYYGSSYKDIISQINAVFNQKMFSVPCPHCLRKVMTADIGDFRKREFLMKNKVQFAYTNTGCKECNHTGRVVGKNQPYAEHIIFDKDLTSALLKCDEPYQMEDVLRNVVCSHHVAMEDYLLDAVKSGALSLDCLDSIL